jgi:cation:H+ antiporter
MLFNILILIISFIVLIKSGNWVVQALSCIARFLKWSEFMVAFVMVAFVSSLPELFIGISSALHGIPEASFGNIIGANVINLTLAVGLAVFLMGGVQIERELVKKDALYTAGVAILPLILILDGKLSRVDGAILLVLFIFYALWLFSKKERFSKVYNNNNQHLNLKGFLKSIFMFLGGIILLLISANLIINRVVAVAETLKVSSVYIGIFLISIGTALPETYFAVRAALKGKKEMILGNLMGAVIITSLFVLGIVALISPIEIIDFSPYLIARIFLFIAAISFFIFIKTGERISKKEAIFLVAVYFAFVVAEILSVC